jgi:uncharacterized protein (TIGR03437 family)
MIAADATNLPPGAYYGSVQIHAPPDSPVAITVPVTFNVTLKQPVSLQPGSPLVASIVNAASQTVGAIAPGEIVSLLGLELGPQSPASYQLDAAGNVATSLAGLSVLFDGVPAPLLYVSQTQVNTVVPYEVAGKTSVEIAVEINGMRFTTGAPVAASAPAVFTADATGHGQASAYNSDTSTNSAANPAARGSAISLFATGAGQTVPDGITGQISQGQPSQPVLGVSVKIGSTAAVVQSVAPVPGQVAGLFKLIAIVPPAVAPGPSVPVVLTVGSSSGPSGVTIAVQ